MQTRKVMVGNTNHRAPLNWIHNRQQDADGGTIESKSRAFTKGKEPNVICDNVKRQWETTPGHFWIESTTDKMPMVEQSIVRVEHSQREKSQMWYAIIRRVTVGNKITTWHLNWIHNRQKDADGGTIYSKSRAFTKGKEPYVICDNAKSHGG